MDHISSCIYIGSECVPQPTIPGVVLLTMAFMSIDMPRLYPSGFNCETRKVAMCLLIRFAFCSTTLGSTLRSAEGMSHFVATSTMGREDLVTASVYAASQHSFVLVQVSQHMQQAAGSTH